MIKNIFASNKSQKQKSTNLDLSSSELTNPTAGFTLIEAVIYVVAFAIISIALVDVIISINKTYGAIKSTQALETSASDILNGLSRDIRNATSIDSASSTFGVSPGSLGLLSKDNFGNVRAVEYYVDSEKMLQVKENGISVGKLTSSSTPVSSLVFTQVQTNNSTAVKIDLSLQTLKDKATITESFHSTYILRGSYK